MLASARSDMVDSGVGSRTELDSHANMVVVGRNCTVFDSTGKTCTVNSFAESAGRLEHVPIVDAVVAYDCPYNAKVYLLLMRNALQVSDIQVNLLPPFIVREAGLHIDDCPKSQSPEPTVDTHCIYSKESDLRIHFGLNDTFSYFHTRKPTDAELASCDKIFVTPDSSWWDPHSSHFSQNEESMLTTEGGVVPQHHRIEHLVDDRDYYHDLPTLDAVEARMDSVMASAMQADEVVLEPGSDPPPVPANCSMASIDMDNFSESCSLFALKGKIEAAIGSVMADDGDIKDCPLFTTTLDELEFEFQSEISAVDVKDSPNGVSPEFLKKIWSITDAQAQGVVEQTTQLNRQSADGSLARQFSTNDRMLRYRRIQSYFFTDTMFVTKAAKSTRGNICLQLFVSDKGFVAVYPMESKSDFPDALHLFCKEVGVPISLVVDPSGEQTSRLVRRFCNQVGTTLRILEESTQWANRAELYIGLLKKAIRRDLRESNCPMVLWDYCAQRRALIHNLTPRNLFQLENQNPNQATTGSSGDISNLCRFGYYDWVYYKERAKNSFPKQVELLGRVLGPSKNEGNEMAQWVLTGKGTVVPRRSCRRLTDRELVKDTEVKRREIFDKIITAKLGDSMALPTVPVDKPSPDDVNDFTYDSRDADEDEPQDIVDEDPVDRNGVPIFENSFGDTLINAEVLLPQGEEMQKARVRKRRIGLDGNEIGSYDENPMLNSLIYEVQFPDGSVREYGANVIAENIYSQVDEHGYRQQTLDSIVEHTKDGRAVPKSEKYATTKSGSRRLRKSTLGWKLLVRWKDGSEQWIPLKRLKENYPVQTAEYAKANAIDDEAAFCWWVPYTLRKRDKIIASVKARVKTTTIKFGIVVPRSLGHARKLDTENGDTLWADAVSLEMNTILPALDLTPDNVSPSGYTRSSGHIIFDVKMDFTRKARWVKDGHLTPDPDTSNFAGVVSRESVRIALTYAALNDLEVCAGDIKSAYLQAPTSEKHYIICGAEFPLEWQGRVAIIRRALYGGKCAGSDYWKHMRTCMEHLGFESCKGDPDIWMRKAIHPKDGREYWEYVLLYVDDCLCCSHRPRDVLEKEIGKYWTMKKGSVGPPTIYLGNKVSHVTLVNGVKAWSFSSSQYVQGAVENVERYLKLKGKFLPRKASTPLSAGYRPEIDTSKELAPSEASYYMSLVGILRWIVELGRVDITCEVSMMASMMAMPREGHLEQLFNMFGFLKSKHNAEMVFDPTVPDIDKSQFPRQEWGHTPYSGMREQLPPKMKKPLGFGFIITAYVDSDHAGDSVTRRSRTGFIVFLNNAPIYWLSKKQNSCETSSYGSEFRAMKHCCEYIRGLRYKLREMGIPVEFHAYIYGDNKSVLANSTVPDSVLRKKANSIAYHFVREGSAMDEWRITYINTHENIADLFTKPLGGAKRIYFVRKILHHIYQVVA